MPPVPPKPPRKTPGESTSAGDPMGVPLWCPVCFSRAQKQPVIVELALTFHPWLIARGPGGEAQGYSDELEHPQFRYTCPREHCGYGEIHTKPPVELPGHVPSKRRDRGC